MSTQPISIGSSHSHISKEQSIVNTPVESTTHKQRRVNNTTNVQQHNPTGVLNLSANSSHNPHVGMERDGAHEEPFVAVSSSSVQPSVLHIRANQQFRIPNNAFSDRTILESVQSDATHPCVPTQPIQTQQCGGAHVFLFPSRGHRNARNPLYHTDDRVLIKRVIVSRFYQRL